MIPKSPTGRTQAQDRARRRNSSKAEYARVCQLVDARDGGLCRHCGRVGQHHHHLTFRSQGGTHTTQNLILVCVKCHDDIHAHRVIPVWTTKGGNGLLQWSYGPGAKHTLHLSILCGRKNEV